MFTLHQLSWTWNDKNTSRKKCTHCGQLILGKSSKFDARRCQTLRLKCTKFDFCWDSASEPAGGAYSHTYRYWYSITHPLFHSRPKTFLLCKSVPPRSLSFSSSGFTTWIPQTFTVTSEHIRLLLFSFFSVLHFLVVGSVRQIKLTRVGFRAHVKIASRIVSYPRDPLAVFSGRTYKGSEGKSAAPRRLRTCDS